MWFGRIGGLLVVGGGVLFVVAGWIYWNGSGLDWRFVDGSLALFAGGAAVLAIGGPPPLNGRLVRVGLGTLAIGQLSYLAVSIMFAAPTVEPRGTLTLILLRVALWGPFLGLLLTGLSLLRAAGLSRAVGSVLLAGSLLLALMTTLGPRIALPHGAALLALAVAVLGNTGVGMLAINGSRSSTVAPM